MAKLLDRFRKKDAVDEAAKALEGTLLAYPHLMKLKPKERYTFRSDYFNVDGYVGAILGFFHDDGAHDDFAAFWGINRIPTGLPEGVTVVVLEQVERMGESWVDARQKVSDRLDKMNENETETTASTRRKQAKVLDDMDIISGELQDGASYLNVHNRLYIKAPDLETLEAALTKIEQLYIDRFATVKAAAYHGEQRQELSNLFRPNAKKRGKGFHFTSTEFAGSYSLVTNGLNDPTGEYVGYMVGDVNNSAVVMDVDKYDHHVVVANNATNSFLNRSYISDMWGSKISQAALLRNRRVIHLNLDGADMDILGPGFDNLTFRVDMNSGDVNMFEMFGDEENELGIFPAHLQKLVLMAEQAYETTDSDRSIIRGSLEEILTEFYVDQGMWYRNAKQNRERLRLVGIPHEQVPMLQIFIAYLDSRYKELANSTARDDEVLHAISVLRLVFRNLLANNGDLFNTTTNPAIDGARDGKRVLYDFGKLMRRGKGVAMAQLVNIIGFAVDYLGLGDTVIIHGADSIDPGVRAYMESQFAHLYARGGRVVFLYNSVESMLRDSEFNKFDAADYTVLGTMRESVVKEYQTKLVQNVPADLERLITQRSDSYNYLRRGVTNVVFALDLALGVNPNRDGKRRVERKALRKQYVTETLESESTISTQERPARENSPELIAAQTQAREEQSRAREEARRAELDKEREQQRERILDGGRKQGPQRRKIVQNTPSGAAAAKPVARV